MEKYNEKMEEVQGRISDTEDNIEKMSEVIEEIYDFKAEWEKTLTEIDKAACRMRKNNIIFKGLKSWSKDTSVALKNFERVCIEKLKLSREWVKKVDLNEVYHFPPKGKEGPWPLFVGLAKSRHREDIYKHASNLKDSGIIMCNDLAPCLLKIRKKLVDKSIELKKEPFNYQIKMRNTAFNVWLEVKKPNETKWETWKGKT